MDLFEEISEAKKDFPKVNKIASDVKSYTLNFYQIFAIGLFICFLCLGILFGNLFSTCEASSYFYSASCLTTQFNYSIMLLIWFVGALISLFIFAIGHIVALLGQISEKLSKFKL